MTAPEGWTLTRGTRDRATGPCTRCTRRTWAIDRVCRRCVTAARRAAHEDIALSGGEWRPRGLIQVFVKEDA